MNTQTKQKQIKRRSIFVTSLAFFIISFLGWLYEVLLMLTLYGEYYDRGFLTLPFCPIYGGVVCGLYLLVGTPREGWFARWLERLGARKSWNVWLVRIFRYIGYFTIAMLFATIGELVIGLIFESLGCSLWSYATFPYNYKGVICLPVSLFWGGLITVTMRYPFAWLLRALEKVPRTIAVAVSIVLAVVLMVDFVFCLMRL